MEMDYLGKKREVKKIIELHCEVQGCLNFAEYQVNFTDGLWANVCADHDPRRQE